MALIRVATLDWSDIVDQQFNNLERHGDYCFLTDSTGDVVSLLVVDVSTPSNPTIVGMYQVEEGATQMNHYTGVRSDGNYLFGITEGYAGGNFFSFNVTNKAAPVENGSCALPVPGGHYNFGNGGCVLLNDDIAVVWGAREDSGNRHLFQTIDISDPAAPVLLSTTQFTVGDAITDGRPVVFGNYIFFNYFVTGTGARVLRCYDLSTPSSPVFVADSPATAEGGQNLTRQGNYIQWLTQIFPGYQIETVDISDPSNMQIVATAPITLDQSDYAMEYGGSRILITDFQDLSTVEIDASNPLALEQKSRASGDAGTLSVSNSFAFVMGFVDDGLGGNSSREMRVYFLYGSGSNTSFQNVFLAIADTDGDVQTFNAGFSDNGEPIFFELETQELEFGNRSHLKNVTQRIAVYTQEASGTTFGAYEDDGDLEEIEIDLTDPVALVEDVDLQGHYLTFRWSGSASDHSPIFEGFYLEKITDEGITKG